MLSSEKPSEIEVNATTDQQPIDSQPLTGVGVNYEKDRTTND